ncbi:MAG TPA: class I SAM-dependent methyltransferase [Thermoanaerobaculia bacterium]|nr:class I SAM-dependent methyltransferase [Thermoanaerobaculia bacterium]
MADAGARPSPPSPPARRTPRVDDFLVEPTRELEDWHWLWKEDREFPIRSHRGLFGRVLVAWKRLLRPLVKVPQNDLWERQRIFNVVLLEHLRDERQRRHRDEERIAYLEALNAEGIEELMRHDDALFARADQKLDRYRREARDLLASLGATLARVESLPRAESGAAAEPAGGTGEEGLEEVSRRVSEHAYFELERRYRGTEEEIRERIAGYLPYLAAGGPALDLGCGRGEALALLGEHGIAARGVDGSARMVAMCRERGLDAVQGDLFAALAAAPAGSLGAVLSFHVVEHLPIGALDRLVRLAWGALRHGGTLILETPSPLSLVVGARNFWLDPTHARPVHPESLRLLYELAGFDPVERLDLRPFPAAERLPEIELARLPPEQRVLADAVNRLRDHLDDLLYGCQDFALIGVKPVAAGDS